MTTTKQPFTIQDRDDSDFKEDSNSLQLSFQRTDKSRQAKKRKRQTIVVLILLFIVIIGIIVMLTSIESAGLNKNNSSVTQCHYADTVYPIDNECGVQKCFDNYPLRSFTIRYGWSNELIMERNQTALDMLQYLDMHYQIFPNILEVTNNQSSMMKYEDMNITLGAIHISIEYFCCYSDEQYGNIKKLYEEYTWDEFDVYFGDFMCLNMTDINKTIHVLLLDEASQNSMSEWTDNFEAYLIENGVELLSKPRKYGQPFHSTFAVFNEYDRKMEALSVDVVTYLNDKYGSIWNDVPIKFAKDNVEFV